ncbi:MAG: HlyC/CorC family transporter [Clostridia bacterium]|nr:HlyC/CorC family transporter [Clostridia bacterium]
MLICIIFSAYFSATETAFSSLNKTRLKVMAEKGNKRAKLTFELAEKYDKLISTILIGNNIVNIAVSSIGTLLFVALIGNMGATVSTVVITVVVLIFGEIIPKSIAKDFPEGFAMFSAPFIRLIMLLFAPLNVFFTGLKKLVSKLFGSKQDNKMSQEELLMLIEEVEQEGSLDESEGELIRNAVEFGDLTAQDILTHRVNLEAINVQSTKEEVAEAFTGSRYSRLLVFEDSIDKIVGVIHQKDFYCGTGVTDKPVTEYMTPPVFIAPTQKIDDLLETLQRAKAHIAVVLDEYGGTLGIVTMEDILEELVGEIWDEHDEVEEPIKELAEDTFSVDCSISLIDFSDKFDIKTEADSVSLGGWVTEQVEHIPEVGESFEYENLLITVTAADDHKVDTVKVVIRDPVPVEEE